jgi:hypothetical protein
LNNHHGKDDEGEKLGHAAFEQQRGRVSKAVVA